MKLSQFIDAKNVVTDLPADEKSAVIRRLSTLLYDNGFLRHTEEFIQAVNEREQHCTTGIGGGIAIPHGKSTAVNATTVAVAKLKQGVEWAALDDQPVQVVFLLAIAEKDAADLHLRLLQQIAVKLMDEKIVTELHKAFSADGLLAALDLEPEDY